MGVEHLKGDDGGTVAVLTGRRLERGLGAACLHLKEGQICYVRSSDFSVSDFSRWINHHFCGSPVDCAQRGTGTLSLIEKPCRTTNIKELTSEIIKMRLQISIQMEHFELSCLDKLFAHHW